MAQHDYVIANQSGASFRADLNNGLAAIVSNNSGASAPSTTFAFQWWADTTNNVLKMRNAANDGWITIRELDGDYETIGLNNGTAAAPSLYFAEDADDNTGLFSGGADQLNITTGGTERAEFGASEVVFNDGGANYDFRVEGDSNTNLVVVDASADSIGIGTNAPGTLIEIDNAAPYVTVKNNTQEDTDGGRESRLIFEGEQSGGEISTLAQIEVSHDGAADDEKGKLVISTNDGSDGATPTAAVTIDSSQNVTLAGGLTVGSGNVSLPADLTVAGSATVGELNGGPLAGMRNRIINGDMRIDQRNAGSAVTINTTANTYTVDRWFASAITSDGVFTVDQTTDAPAGFTNSTRITVTTADASIAATDIYLFRQAIEGNNVYDLAFGTASAETITFSFWVRSSLTGTFGGALNNSANDRNYPFTYSISASNTWEHKTVTVAGDTTGTWLTDEERGLTLTFQIGAGSSRVGTAGSWTGTSAVYGATGATNIIETLNATWDITGVQLETGTVATPFERRSYGDELARCQRYYQQFSGIIYGTQGSASYAVWQFKQTFRAQPTCTGQVSGGTVDFRNVDFVSVYKNAAYAYWQNGTATAEL